jgi:Uma2 family endonuclease
MNAPLMPSVLIDFLYPDSDGQPMSDNTLQWECVVTLKCGLEVQYRDDENVFVAGDLLWYAREGHPQVRAAPDALTAFGRPKGYRGSYKQWEEGGIAPQVVFEVLSPGNRAAEMQRKFEFYDEHGVEEYYVYDPYTNQWSGWQRGDDSRLHEIPAMTGWVSPRLKVRFEVTAGDLELYHPDGRRFATYSELAEQAEQERREREEAQRHADKAQRHAEKAQRRADKEKERADKEKERADRLAAQMRALGIDPEA